MAKEFGSRADMLSSKISEVGRRPRTLIPPRAACSRHPPLLLPLLPNPPLLPPSPPRPNALSLPRGSGHASPCMVGVLLEALRERGGAPVGFGAPALVTARRSATRQWGRIGRRGWGGGCNFVVVERARLLGSPRSSVEAGQLTAAGPSQVAAASLRSSIANAVERFSMYF